MPGAGRNRLVKGAVVASLRRGHRKKGAGIRSRGVRVATAALALSGAGLTITGVANAVTAPSLAPGKVIDGPLDVPGAYADVPTGDPAADPTTDPAAPTTVPADPGSTAPSDPGTSAAAPTTPADPGTTAPGTGGGSPSTGPTATGGSSGSGVLVQAPARQTLAETGNDDSVPFLLAGGFTLLAGGLVFRFGPRTGAPRHGA
jgi:LPXTG-motif cell wall-anchored protein